jgi:hypothetical protein
MVRADSVPAEQSHRGVNQPPTVDGLRTTPSRPAPGRVVEAEADVSDPDGGIARVSFRWQTARGRVLGEGDRLDTRGLEPGTKIVLVAVATDGIDESEEVTHEFRLQQPSIEVGLIAIDDSEGTAPGSLLKAVVESTDEQGERFETELEWLVNGEVVETDEEELETDAYSPGDVVELRAAIDSERGRSRTVTSQPVVLTRGEAPTIVSQPTAEFTGGLFQYRMQARSPMPGAELTFQLLSGPEGMAVDARSGVVAWRPMPEQRGKFQVEVGVVDQWGTGAAQAFVIQADSPGAPPASAR